MTSGTKGVVGHILLCWYMCSLVFQHTEVFAIKGFRINEHFLFTRLNCYVLIYRFSEIEETNEMLKW